MSLLPIQGGAQLLQLGTGAGTSLVTGASAFAQRLGTALWSAVNPGGTAQNPMPALATVPPGASRAADLAALRGELSSLLQSFHDRLQQRFTRNGISAGAGLQLQQDGTGSLRVVGDNPQKAQIEALLATDPGLENLAGGIAGVAQLLNSAGGPNPLADGSASSSPPVAGISGTQFLTLFVGPTRTTAAFAPANSG